VKQCLSVAFNVDAYDAIRCNITDYEYA